MFFICILLATILITLGIYYENNSKVVHTDYTPGDHYIDITNGAILPAENDHYFAYKRYPCQFYSA